jgi:hypothetical protein
VPRTDNVEAASARDSPAGPISRVWAQPGVGTVSQLKLYEYPVRRTRSISGTVTALFRDDRSTFWTTLDTSNANTKPGS